VFKERVVTQKVFVKFHKCEVVLCIKKTYFENYHTLRDNSNIRCDLLKKNWGLKPIYKSKRN